MQCNRLLICGTKLNSAFNNLIYFISLNFACFNCCQEKLDWNAHSTQFPNKISGPPWIEKALVYILFLHHNHHHHHHHLSYPNHFWLQEISIGRHFLLSVWKFGWRSQPESRVRTWKENPCMASWEWRRPINRRSKETIAGNAYLSSSSFI